MTPPHGKPLRWSRLTLGRVFFLFSLVDHKNYLFSPGPSAIGLGPQDSLFPTVWPCWIRVHHPPTTFLVFSFARGRELITFQVGIGRWRRSTASVGVAQFPICFLLRKSFPVFAHGGHRVCLGFGSFGRASRPLGEIYPRDHFHDRCCRDDENHPGARTRDPVCGVIFSFRRAR